MLDEAGLVHDQHAARVPQILDDVCPNSVADGIDIPVGGV
jgi:hypothetical protein